MTRNASSNIALVALFSSCLSLSAATVTWTGAVNANWDESGNWSPSAPTTSDTAVFPSGVSGTVTLTAASAAARIEIAATGLTLGGSDVVALPDIAVAAGTTNTVSTKLDIGGTVTWTIGEGALLTASGAFSGTGEWIKDGPGEVKFTHSSSSWKGMTTVRAGLLIAGGQQFQLGGGLTIGGAGVPARVNQMYNNPWNYNQFGATASITVRAGGLYDLTAYNNDGERSQSVGDIVVDKGGEIRLGGYKFLPPSNGEHVFCAGTISSFPDRGGLMTAGGVFVVPETADAAVVCPTRFYSQSKWVSNHSEYATFKVPDIPGVPVDLTIHSAHWSWDGRDGIDKRGPGVLRILEPGLYGGSSNEGATRLYEGTLLIDNETGSGTGYSNVAMSPGTTFGGTGTVGGFAEDTVWSGRQTALATKAKVVANGSSEARSTIAPGTVDPDTGAHVHGTLTVGSADQASSVTFGDYTTLRVSVGANGAGDSLAVYGTISVGAAGTILDVAVDPSAEPGEYVLASATEGITGSFATVRHVGRGTIALGDNGIVLTVYNPATVLFVR